MNTRAHVTIILTLAICQSASAAVTEFTDKSAWQAAAGSHTTITFTEFPVGTIVTNHYAHLDVLFTDGIDQINASSAFVNDGFGLLGAFDETTVEFSQPTFVFALDFPGAVQFDVFKGDLLVHSSSEFGGGGLGFFAGIVSSDPFDKIVIVDPQGGLFFDDLHFGPPIPVPGGLAIIVGGLLALRRRRRCG